MLPVRKSPDAEANSAFDEDKQGSESRESSTRGAEALSIERAIEPIDETAHPNNRMADAFHEPVRIADDCFDQQGQ